MRRARIVRARHGLIQLSAKSPAHIAQQIQLKHDAERQRSDHTLAENIHAHLHAKLGEERRNVRVPRVHRGADARPKHLQRRHHARVLRRVRFVPSQHHVEARGGDAHELRQLRRIQMLVHHAEKEQHELLPGRQVAPRRRLDGKVVRAGRLVHGLCVAVVGVHAAQQKERRARVRRAQRDLVVQRHGVQAEVLLVQKDKGAGVRDPGMRQHKDEIRAHMLRALARHGARQELQRHIGDVAHVGPAQDVLQERRAVELGIVEYQKYLAEE